jgi:hypothetical protein
VEQQPISGSGRPRCIPIGQVSLDAASTLDYAFESETDLDIAILLVGPHHSSCDAHQSLQFSPMSGFSD